MHNADDFLKLIKKSAMDAQNASKPSDVAFGKVLSESPLTIQIDQKLILTSSMLVLTRNVTEYKVEMTVDHMTEKVSGGSGEAAFAEHQHPYVGRKVFLVHNALQTGEEVLLIRKSGGQKYIVVDRLGAGQ